LSVQAVAAVDEAKGDLWFSANEVQVFCDYFANLEDGRAPVTVPIFRVFVEGGSSFMFVLIKPSP
jgi:hypothetical protein